MTDQLPRRFRLIRDVDETGTSGTGVVVEGLEFTDGTVALRWLTATTSTAIYASITDVETIHGHGGKTRVVWVDQHDDEPPAAYRQLLARLEADRARMLAAMDVITVDEVRIAQASLASGYLHAAAWAVQLFEGAEARDKYLRDRADGVHLATHDGPTITEAAADDRRWDLEKAGE
ncbi:hypothetical protein [Streptomyces flavofungini]|uniref:hypothetical protein n=1 Tax=Streptomyces flavofungini TaxID=68200 RepID=UPI0034DF2D38